MRGVPALKTRTDPDESGSVSQIPSGDVRGAQGAGARRRAAAAGAAERADQSRLSVQRSARVWEDVECADPGPVTELRAGAHARSLRGVRLVCRAGAVRARQHRRDRDRRGLARRRGRRQGTARAGLLHAGVRALQDLHHRRGAHGHPAGLQRAAEAGRGAAAAPEVHLRHHRAGEGHPDHQVAHPPLPVPPGPAVRAARADAGHPAPGGRGGAGGGAAAGGAGRRGLGPGFAVRPGPAAGRQRRVRGQLRARGFAARLHRRQPAGRDRGRVRGGRRRGDLPRGEPGHRGRPRAAPVRGRPAGPAPRPDRAGRGARRGRQRAARPAAGPGRADGPAGGQLRPGRAGPRCRDRQHRPGPDARRNLAPAAARADVRPGAAAGRRHGREIPARPAGTAGKRDAVDGAAVTPAPAAAGSGR